MNIGFRFNMDIVNHVQKIDTSLFGSLNTAYLSQQINNDTNELIIFGLTFIQNIITHSLTFIIPIVLLSRINVFVTAVMVFVTFLYTAAYLLTKRIIHENNKAFKEAQSTFFSCLNEQLRYITFIKLHSVYSWFEDRLRNAFDLLFHAGIKQQVFSLRFSSINSLILTLLQLSLFLVGGKAIIDGNLTVGQFTIFSTYFSLMTSSMNYFVGLGKKVQESMVSYSRIKKIMDMPVAPSGTVTPIHINSITIHDLSFSYGDNIIFSHNNFNFETGKLYIICGSNGSGKSTLIDILAGMFIGDHLANVFINDCSMQALNLEYYREKLLAISEQDTFLVADTFLNNIAFGSPEQIDSERLNELISIFKLNNLLKQSNQSMLDLVINEKNSNLSGGEKQKISIIRTLLKDTDIMIFDEPTSAMDIESKHAFYKIIEDIKKDKIIIVVSHDRSFFNLADEIIDIDELKTQFNM